MWDSWFIVTMFGAWLGVTGTCLMWIAHSLHKMADFVSQLEGVDLDHEHHHG